MKIVYISRRFATTSGAERITTDKANYLVSCGEGHSVYFITYEQNGQTPFFPIDPRIEMLDMGLTYFSFEVAGSNPLSRAYNRWLLHKKQRYSLQKLIDKIQPDVIVLPAMNPIAPMQIKTNAVRIIESHASSLAAELQWSPSFLLSLGGIQDTLLIALRKKALKRSDTLVTLTTADKKTWHKLGISNVCVIGNFQNIPITQPANMANKEVLAVGRLTEQKNFAELLDIWSMVEHDFPDWKLRICGSGELEYSLKERREEKRREEKRREEDSVIFTPQTPNIINYYQKASVMALSSHHEGLPLTLLEGQAIGLPIVAYDCPTGPRDIISNGKDGFLIPLYNKEAFADTLRKLMSDNELRLQMSRNAQLSAKRFNKESIMQQWKKLFNELIGNRHKQ